VVVATDKSATATAAVHAYSTAANGEVAACGDKTAGCADFDMLIQSEWTN